MSYEPVIIFPSDGKTTMTEPDGPVDLYVARTDLFGSKILGSRGLYHSGLLFESGNKSWLIDLSIKNNMSNMLPYITNDGEVAVNNTIVLEYYSPETKNSWQSYWNNKGEKICTISSHIYDKLINYILETLGPDYDHYIPFSITNKPYYTIYGEDDKIISKIYASDNTCDKMPMHCFEWLKRNYRINIIPFSVTRVVLTVNQKPNPITDMRDPGLIAYTQKIQSYMQDFAKIHKKDPYSLFDLYEQFEKQKEEDFYIFEYVLANDNLTKKPQWYKLPIKDVAISAEDMFYKTTPLKLFNKNTIIILVLLVIIIIFLFLVFRK